MMIKPDVRNNRSLARWRDCKAHCSRSGGMMENGVVEKKRGRRPLKKVAADRIC